MLGLGSFDVERRTEAEQARAKRYGKAYKDNTYDVGMPEDGSNPFVDLYAEEVPEGQEEKSGDEEEEEEVGREIEVDEEDPIEEDTEGGSEEADGEVEV